MSENNQKKAKKNNTKISTSDEFFDLIKTKVKGLVLISEIDAEITAFRAENSDTFLEELNSLSKLKRSRLEQLGPERFFKNPTTHRDWHTEIHRERVNRFIEIEKLLNNNLNDLTSYRVGKTEIDIFVVGKFIDGSIVGIKTNTVET